MRNGFGKNKQPCCPLLHPPDATLLMLRPVNAALFMPPCLCRPVFAARLMPFHLPDWLASLTRPSLGTPD